MPDREAELDEAEAAAFDRLVERGGASSWVPIGEVGDPDVVESLESRGVVRVREEGPESWVTMGATDPPEDPGADVDWDGVAEMASDD